MFCMYSLTWIIVFSVLYVHSDLSILQRQDGGERAETQASTGQAGGQVLKTKRCFENLHIFNITEGNEMRIGLKEVFLKYSFFWYC